MSNELVKKAPMTDAERLALAAKLDQDLDEFINGLEKKRYTEGWPEDRWEEEMDKHPFFMKTLPKEGDELHPLLEGIQQLKYDTEDNTKEDLASTYRDDGNFYMKNKKFRMAIYCYTEGLNQKCESSELNSILYNNRSAAHYFIQNYRSSLGDAKKAITLNPLYIKAEMRAAQCNNSLEKYDECILHCDGVLLIDAAHKPALELRKSAQQKKANRQRDARKQNALERKKQEQLEKTVNALALRNVKFDGQKGNEITVELMRPCLGPLEDFPVHLDDDGQSLIWPAAFCYPEFLFSDFQQQLSENAIMSEVLVMMFSEPLECDKKNHYKADTLNVYFENRISGKVFKVNLQHTIKQIVSNKFFLVTGGSLTFYIVPRDSDVEKEYVNKLRRPTGL